ncbi:MAG: hypothetical protein M3083_03280 [Actinomycetota bacterium]|nr:hypothetical protein [Actinomycetota bacterium]MDQ6946882.1 hypothetical protein [Actinomycetota bacterium]
MAPVVAAICRRLDGLPLAVELAAARLRVLSPSEIAERLDDRFNLLTARGRAGERRHNTLHAAIEWSHGILTDTEATLFRRLGVFASGWGLLAAETVCAGDDLRHEETLDLLEAQHPAIERGVPND